MTERREPVERPHVLIVSGDEGLSSFLSEGLVLGGFWTSTVASGIQTLEVFRLRTFDLILLDAALGDLDSLEVVRRLRGTSDRASQSGPKIDLPIVLIAATPDEVDPPEAIAAGVDQIVVAPLELETLIPELHRWHQEYKSRRG
jgi:DNA-binding response OmpR family regulator